MICESRFRRLLGLREYYNRHRILLNQYGINPDTALILYHTPLHRMVAVCSRQEVAEELLKHGVDVNAAGSDGITPLHQAILSKRDVGIVSELLHHGARVNAAGSDGITPLHQAILSKRDVGIVSELLHHGARVNAAGSDGITPLHQAILSKRDVGIVSELLHHGARVNAACYGGNTPLDLAAKVPSGVSNIKKLLQHGAVLSSVDSTKCNKLLRSTILSVSSSKLLIKTTLIRQFKGDPFDLFNLVPYQKLLIGDVLSSYIEDCVSEVVKMKTMEVKRGFSFYDFVTTTNTNILLYPDAESTRAITQEGSLKADYPIYYDVILPRVRYALQRTMLLHKLHEAGRYSGNYCSLITSHGEESVLNCDSAAAIASYLCNDDLLNFMVAFYRFNVGDLNFHGSTTALKRQRLKKPFDETLTSSGIKKTRLT